jgi:hypothetical protein
MIPTFAPLKEPIIFDQSKVYQELMANGWRNRSVLATTTFKNGQSQYKGTATFNDERFSETANVTHYVDGKLVDGNDTFHMMNLTYQDERSKEESWDEDRTIPLWIKNQGPWLWRDELDIPYTRSVIERLPFEHITTTRVITLNPETVGVIHADSGTIMNQKYYSDGNGSITLNITAGGGNLWVLTDSGERLIDESKYTQWHFNDAKHHCVTKTNSIRVQLRIFGKLKKPYIDLLDMSQAIF